MVCKCTVDGGCTVLYVGKRRNQHGAASPRHTLRGGGRGESRAQQQRETGESVGRAAAESRVSVGDGVISDDVW